MSTSYNLRDKEIQLLSKMLTLGKSQNDSNEDFTDQWKVLIYDQDCRDIISPLMNIGSLRQKGITLHMLLHSDREPIDDAPVIYFVRPTEENVMRIAEDCAKKLYRSAYINFVTRIERPIMEKFAQAIVASNSVSTISKIYDQYLDCVALEPSLFSLNYKQSFMAYNDPSLSESQIRLYISKISTGLLSLVRVMGAIPIIRAPAGGAAEMLARELCDNLRENLSLRGPAQSLFTDCLISDRARPLLLIFDRTCDMSPPLLHTSTYQGLIDDLLDHRLNRVTIDNNSKDAQQKKKTYDLNTQDDSFFARFAGSPFPEAVEANESELAEVSQREMDIRSRPLSAQSDVPSSSSDGKDLTDAIESLPEILAKKTNLGAHTNILQSVMKEIIAREVSTYFELEQSMLMAGRIGSTDRIAVLALLKDETKGSVDDKARLLALVSALSDGSSSSAKYDKDYEQAFQQGCKLMIAPVSEDGEVNPNIPPSQEVINKKISAATFIRRLQSLQAPSKMGNGLSSQGQSNAMLSSFLNTAQR
jgi:hypothetical protein